MIHNSKFNRCGFTLVEIIVVVSITVFLSTVLITLSRQSRTGINLDSERLKIAQVIQKVRSYAVSGVVFDPNRETPHCAYGLSIEPSERSYTVFTLDTALPNDCGSNLGIPVLPDPRFVEKESYSLPSEIQFTALTDLAFVLFLNQPKIGLIFGDENVPASPTSLIISLEKTDGSQSSQPITLSPAGQIGY